MTDDRELDRLLHEEGARWRGAVTVDLDVDAVPFRELSDRRRLGQFLAAVGSLAVIAIAVVVVVGLRVAPIGPSASGNASTQPLDTEGSTATAQPLDSPWPAVDTTPYLGVVYPGDRVIASGALVSQKGKLYLCPTFLVTLMNTGSTPGCSMESVLVWGADEWAGKGVKIEGTWDGNALTATAVSDGPRAAAPSVPPIPCDPPAGGWPGNPTSENESAGLALEPEITNNPQRYVGLWVALTRDANGEVSNRAVVVGTVDDVESVTAALTEIYPFNLCVVSVDFTVADLMPIVSELRALGYPWLVNFDPTVGRVDVSMTTLSPAMAEALVRYSNKVVVHSTLRPATSPGTDPDEPVLRVIAAVNFDTINFGGVYIERGGSRDGELVIQYIGANAGRAAVEARITTGLAVRWEKVDYSQSELHRIAGEIRDLNLAGVFSISAGTSRNRVVVIVGPTGSIGDVSKLLASKYGGAVEVEFSADIPLIQPGFSSPLP